MIDPKIGRRAWWPHRGLGINAGHIISFDTERVCVACDTLLGIHYTSPFMRFLERWELYYSKSEAQDEYKTGADHKKWLQNIEDEIERSMKTP